MPKAQRQPPPNQKLLQSLDRKLWKLFSLYIRQRDCKDGVCKCISCGKYIVFEKADAGHFMNRGLTNTKFNEKNVNAQCRKCNRFEEGSQFEQSFNIDAKYGEGTAKELLQLSKFKFRFSVPYYEAMIEKYEKLVKH